MARYGYVLGLDRMIEDKVGEQTVRTLTEIRAKNLHDLLELIAGKPEFVRLFVSHEDMGRYRGKITIGHAGSRDAAAHIFVVAMSSTMVIWTGLPRVLDYRDGMAPFYDDEWNRYNKSSRAFVSDSDMARDEKKLEELGFVRVEEITWRS